MSGRARFHPLTWLRAALLAALALVCAVPAGAAPVTVGGKNFTEQQIVAELTRQLLRARGVDAVARTGYPSAALRRAQEAGELDVVWEYTGTALIAVHRVEERLGAAEAYARVKQLDMARGLAWLAPSRVNNSYALAVRRQEADGMGLRTLSDLAERVRDGWAARLGCNSEFFFRPDGLGPLERHYGFAFDRERVIRIDTSLVAHALRDRQVDVGLVFATDGRIPVYDFVVLGDDRGYFPAYTMAPVVRRETLESVPELAAILGELAGRLDNAVMARLNAAVDLDRRSIEEVAATFLHAEGLT